MTSWAEVEEVLNHIDFGRLELKDGEVLVLRMPEDTSDPLQLAQWDELLSAILERKLGHPVPILVLPHGTDILTMNAPDNGPLLNNPLCSCEICRIYGIAPIHTPIRNNVGRKST